MRPPPPPPPAPTTSESEFWKMAYIAILRSGEPPVQAFHGANMAVDHLRRVCRTHKGAML